MPIPYADTNLSPTSPHNFFNEAANPDILPFIVANGPNLYKLTMVEGVFTAVELATEVPDEATRDGWHDRFHLAGVDGAAHVFLFFCP